MKTFIVETETPVLRMKKYKIRADSESEAASCVPDETQYMDSLSTWLKEDGNERLVSVKESDEKS
jgi:hypothetical protein